MHVNDLLQRTIIEALQTGEFTIEEIRENVDVAIERFEQYNEEDEDNA